MRVPSAQSSVDAPPYVHMPISLTFRVPQFLVADGGRYAELLDHSASYR